MVKEVSEFKIISKNIRKITKYVYCFPKWLYVQIFKGFFYEKKYLSGRWFEDGVCSIGWLWAARDIHYRMKTSFHLKIPWPISPDINCSEHIIFDPDDLNNFNGKGNYFQTFDAKIIIGKGTYIAPNVGIITSNHDLSDLEKHEAGKDVFLGEECWIGMNSIILPGVRLGNHTIVGAGSVVTKSFVKGHCVIAGNPAKIIKNLE